MKNVLFVCAIVLLSTGIYSCKKSSDPAPAPDPNVTYKATINGPSEVPANASAATGTATLVFNTTTKIFTVTVNFTGIAATNGHIHKGAVGVSGGVIFPFTLPITSPVTYTSAALDATQEADLVGGLYYVNLHTAAFPGGEIRGQLIKQ
jgi:CHRD domain